LATHNTIAFSLGTYDHSKPLVIDPTIVYFTVIGGTTASTTFHGMAVDNKGMVYVQGITTATTYPTTSGAYQAFCNAYSATQCSNFFVAKFDPTQSGSASFVYFTYVGGSDPGVGIYNYSSSYPMNDLAVDANEDAYFTGYTGSMGVSSYPVTANAYGATAKQWFKPGVVAVDANQSLSVRSLPANSSLYSTATDTTTITVTPAPLTVSASNATRAYGASNPSFSGSIQGAVNGDMFTESFTTTATVASAPGKYVIVPAAAGANLGNYTQTVVDGSLTVTQAATTTTLAINPLAATTGQSVTFTATVAPFASGTPTGSVTFACPSSSVSIGSHRPCRRRCRMD
jgi:hypothetical protein